MRVVGGQADVWGDYSCKVRDASMVFGDGTGNIALDFEDVFRRRVLKFQSVPTVTTRP